MLQEHASNIKNLVEIVYKNPSEKKTSEKYDVGRFFNIVNSKALKDSHPEKCRPSWKEVLAKRRTI